MQRFPYRMRALGAASSVILCLALLAAFPAAHTGMASAGTPVKEEGQGSAAGSTAPDFSMSGVDGRVYSLKALLEDGPVLLNFWTTWCKPCKLEIPHLQRIFDTHKEHGFTLLGVPSDDTRTAAQVRPMIRSMRMRFPNLPDQNRVLGNLYNVRNYPTTVLISADGRIAHYAQGYRPGDEKRLEEMIIGLLRKPGDGSDDAGGRPGDEGDDGAVGDE